MNASIKVQPAHLRRQAIVYLRQSSTKQVAQNRESAVNQKALRGRLLELGWRAGEVDAVPPGHQTASNERLHLRSPLHPPPCLVGLAERWMWRT